LHALRRRGRTEALTHRDEVVGVALLDEGEVRRGVLRGLHLLRDLPADSDEGLALFEGRGLARGRDDGLRGEARRDRGGGALDRERGGGASGRAVGHRGDDGADRGVAEGLHVLARGATAGPRGRYAVEVDAGLARELAGRGRRERLGLEELDLL